MLALATVLGLAAGASAATVQTFSPPAACPTCQSSNYTGMANGSLPVRPRMKGVGGYSRFIQIWLENTDASSALASQTFQNLASQGILLNSYHGVTHPSEPNYIASIAGDFFGLGDDDYYALPSNVSTMVDLLEAKNISWATYQENIPTTAFSGDYAQKNYLNASATAPYTYYKRKHNPFIICNSVATVPARAANIRNFNSFAVDVNATALPSWVYVAPNLVNDAHDTSVTFVSQWLEYWLVPLLKNPNFNDNETLILLTFDENESYDQENKVYSVLLGGAVSAHAGTTDDTFYTHYSTMSSIQHNWGLGSLGRQDTNATVSNVFAFQAQMTNYTKNVNVTTQPQLNLTGIFPGVANPEMWVPVTMPNMSAVGAGGGSVFTSGINSNVTLANFAPMNLTAMNLVDPATVPVAAANVSGSSMGSASASGSGAAAAASASSGSTSSAGRVAVAGGMGALLLGAAGALML